MISSTTSSWYQNKTSWSIGGDFTVRAYERTLYQLIVLILLKIAVRSCRNIKARTNSHMINPILTMVGSTVITIMAWLYFFL